MISVTRSIVPSSAVSQRFQVSCPVTRCTLEISKFKYISQFRGNRRLEIFSTTLELLYARNTKMDLAVYSGVEPGPAHPSNPFPYKFEAVVETADRVVDIVEEVAEEVGEVAEGLADHLLEGGKLQQVATFVENLAKETAKNAHLADEVIEKVEEEEKEVESFAEQVTGQANGISKEAKD